MKMKVFEPLNVNGMVIPNRLGLSSLLNNPVGEDGGPNDISVKWFEARAQGGVGLVLTGAVQPIANAMPIFRRMSLALYDDMFIPGFAKMADAVHKHGGKFGVQIAAGGPMTGAGPSLPPYPDPVHATITVGESTGGGVMPVRELTIEDLARITDAFAACALRVKKSGADCVELHATHGGASLLCAFISPYYNRREDKYGGSWENRVRLAVETTEKVRKAVGKDFPVLIRLCGDQLVGNRGITTEDTARYIIPALDEAGIDAFDVSQGDILRAPEGITIPMYYPRGCFGYVPEAAKKATKKPVFGAGRIVDIEMAERFVSEGKADLVFMSREFTSDPDTIKKFQAGKADEIRKCIGCLAGCGRPCPVNYDIQDEPVPFTLAKKAKKVLVVGGGVGGMEAARVAAERGHQVTLMEKSGELGGMVLALARTKLTSEFMNFIDYLGVQMRKLNIDVRACEEATPENIKALKPDVIINATGSSMVVPDVAKGKPGVMDHVEACNNQRAIGQNVVIWGLVAAELAISLAQAGKKVTMIGRGGEETLARDYPGSRRQFVIRKLSDVNVPRALPMQQREPNCKVMYFVDVEKIDAKGLHLVSKEGGKSILPYDTLIISRERACNNGLFEKLQGLAPEVYNIGDSAKVGDIKEAVWAANEVARKI